MNTYQIPGPALKRRCTMGTSTGVILEGLWVGESSWLTTVTAQGMGAPRRHGWKDASSCRFHHKPCPSPLPPLHFQRSSSLTALGINLCHPSDQGDWSGDKLLAQLVGVTVLPLCSPLGHQSHYGIKRCCQLPERSKMSQQHSFLIASRPGPAQPQASSTPFCGPKGWFNNPLLLLCHFT